jgi:hypothetical protein
VEGVRRFSEYRTLLDQLAGLEQVVLARMDRADDRGVRFLLRYQSNQALLIDSIVAITGLHLLETSSQTPDLIEEDAGETRGLALPGSEQNPLRFFNPDQNFLPANALGGSR